MKGLTLAFVSSAFLATQTVPPRDAPATPPGTATVRGRVTSAASNQPLHRVRVTLNTHRPNPPTAVTDTRGEFEIAGVPAGSYSITAARDGYLTIQYGQRVPREPGKRIEIGDGETIDDIDIALHRGAVLAGSVGDELGDRYPGVTVEALEFTYIRGHRVPVPAAWTITNDRGEFRLSGLQPGTYMLRASTSETWESDDGTVTHAYAPTHYPGVASSAQAQRFSVSVGQTLANLHFRMIPGRAASIGGVLRNATGEPMASQTITVDRVTRGVGGTPFSMQAVGSTRTNRDGAFAFRPLAPGEYLVYSRSQAERASVPVVVAEGEARTVALTPRRPTTVSGSIVADDGTPPSFAASLLRVTPVVADPDRLLPSFTGAPDANVGRDWTFRVARLEGSYLFRVVGLPEEWMLKSVVLDGRDVTDVPVTSAAGVDATGMRIVISKKGGRVEGRVTDRDGGPAADSTVVVFAADPARWTLASRFVKAARPDAAGRFSIGGLPAGVYRAIAREFVVDGQWEDPEFLAGATADSVRFEMSDGGVETLTLRREPPR